MSKVKQWLETKPRPLRMDYFSAEVHANGSATISANPTKGSETWMSVPVDAAQAVKLGQWLVENYGDAPAEKAPSRGE